MVGQQGDLGGPARRNRQLAVAREALLVAARLLEQVFPERAVGAGVGVAVATEPEPESEDVGVGVAVGTEVITGLLSTRINVDMMYPVRPL